MKISSILLTMSDDSNNLIFAKKSAPPPPPPEDGANGTTSNPTTTDNQPLPPPPPPAKKGAGSSRKEEMATPMDHDGPSTSGGKKSSRGGKKSSKRGAKTDTTNANRSAEISGILSRLKPLDSSLQEQIKKAQEQGEKVKEAINNTRKGGTAAGSSRGRGGAHRTCLGRIPRISREETASSDSASTDGKGESSFGKQGQGPQNKRWPDTSVKPSTSGYTASTPVCLELTSPKFLPDDDKRVGILFRKIHGESIHSDSARGSKLVHLHDFPPVSSEEVTGIPLTEAPGADKKMEDDNFVKIAEFATIPPSGVNCFRTVTKKASISFILLAKSADAPPGARWENPSISLAQDFINDLICRLFDEGKDCQKAYDRTGKWGIVSLIYLQSDNLDALNDMRREIAAAGYKGFNFDSFPKDLTTVKAEVTILLRSSMRTFVTHLIPRVLFARNKELLAGTLKILSTKFFPAEEKSTKGEPKTSWRTLELLGDEQFMRCLARFPESRPFGLGVNAVQIRGGLRPPEPEDMTTLGKRSWSAGSSSSESGISRSTTFKKSRKGPSFARK